MARNGNGVMSGNGNGHSNGQAARERLERLFHASASQKRKSIMTKTKTPKTTAAKQQATEPRPRETPVDWKDHPYRMSDGHSSSKRMPENAMPGLVRPRMIVQTISRSEFAIVEAIVEKGAIVRYEDGAVEIVTWGDMSIDHVAPDPDWLKDAINLAALKIAGPHIASDVAELLVCARDLVTTRVNVMDLYDDLEPKPTEDVRQALFKVEELLNAAVGELWDAAAMMASNR